MSAHHIVPRFHLARWVGATGKIEVIDPAELTVREEDPRVFGALPDFNRMLTPDGEADPWLEHEFLGALDSDAARMMRQLENVPAPRSHLRMIINRRWHPGHLMAPRSSVRFAMYLGAQAVRTPAWRAAVATHTASAIKQHVENKVKRQLAEATDPAELERLNRMLGLRFHAQITGNVVPHLSGHMGYRLGEVLYKDYFWAIFQFSRPALLLGDDPVLILNQGSDARTGSFAQVAGSGGDVLSVYQDLRKFADDATDAMRDNDMVVLPLDPMRALVLSKPDRLVLPGRYPLDLRIAGLFNAVMRKASRRWLVLPPGHAAQAREQIYAAHPWRRRMDEARGVR